MEVLAEEWMGQPNGGHLGKRTRVLVAASDGRPQNAYKYIPIIYIIFIYTQMGVVLKIHVRSFYIR